MADKSLSKGGLPPSSDEETRASERRAFLKRAAIIGLPVALSTVRPRTAWAADDTQSCKNSIGPSGCANRF